ncbi:MAG: hypothetical protein AAGD00_03490 [Planctomycetota bacterium]
MSDEKFDERIEKVEEAQAFAEHTSDQIAEQVRVVFDRMEALHKRMARLEDRLLQIESAASEGEEDEDRPNADLLDHLPPHSARKPGE